jgi:hypothetical protein
VTVTFPEIMENTLTCESCGVEFSCGADTGKCWCFEIDLKDESLAKLREEFNNCLCENCLSEMNASQNSVEPG